MRIVKLTVDAGEKQERLDRLLCRRLRSFSRVEIQELIRQGCVFWEDFACRKSAWHVPGPGLLEVRLPFEDATVPLFLRDENILYEDEELIAIHKPSGYPTRGRLALGNNDLYEATKRWLNLPEGYLGMPHRLDRETSGVLLFCKQRKAASLVQKAFQQGLVHKAYIAWIQGFPEKESGYIDAPIHAPGRILPRVDPEGKPAATWYRVLGTDAHGAMILALPETGRTHQIRLHFAHLGHPILGDRLYGTPSAPRLMLHASRLVLAHPCTQTKLILRASMPKDFDPSRWTEWNRDPELARSDLRTPSTRPPS